MKFSSDRGIAAMRGIRSLSASKYPQPRLLGQTLLFFDYFWSIEFSSIRATIMSFKVYQVVNAQKLIRAEEGLSLGGQPAQWTFSTSITRSNLNIFPIFLKHWTQLIQSYNYASQSMWDSQRAYVDPSGGRVTTRWAATQRSEPFQPQLLNQTSMFFNYFESIEFGWIRATIMPSKVCQVVNAHRLIRAGEGLLLGGRSPSAVNLLNPDY